MIIQDNSTRWNSTYHSIHRGLQLQRRLLLFCSDYSKDLGQDYMQKEDWDQLKQISVALKPFHEATMRTQGKAGNGHHGSVWEVLPLLEALMGAMEQGKDFYMASGKSTKPSLTPLAVAHQNAWDKLKKYYNLTDRTHIYAAALLFNPTQRIKYFDSHWTSTEMQLWKQEIITTVRDSWEQDYKTQGKRDEDEATAAQPMQPDFLDRFLSQPTQSLADGDAFDTYINSAPTYCKDSDEDLLGWWDSRNNPHRQLRQQAFDLLSIPAMSAEVERVFSSAKRFIPPDRNRLSNDTIELLQLLKHWWGNKLITPTTAPPRANQVYGV